MPAAFQDEDIEKIMSDTTEIYVENKTAVAHEDEQMDSSISGVTDSDVESNTSVAFVNEETGTSVTISVDTDAERKNSATSQDEQTGFTAIHVADVDTKIKSTDTIEDDESSTTTSDDSDSDDYDGKFPAQSGPPPPYEPFLPKKPKKPPSFEADPVRYVLGMKLPIADSGYCACHFLTSAYATIFYVTWYASMLITDSFGVVPHIIRTLYAYKFQLLLTYKQQYALHGWTGVLMLISAFVLWIAIYTRSRATLMVWMLVMLAYVLMGMVLMLLGMLLCFMADGWNMYTTTTIIIGLVDISLELYLVHMVYSFNRYMDDEPPLPRYDPQTEARRQFELAQLGYREVNFLGIPITTRIPLDIAPSAEVTSV